jgi:hypothetical protein
VRWLVPVLAVVAAGCPTPVRYHVVRPDLGCERATRVAYRTMVELGYTVTDVVPAGPHRVGAITGSRVRRDGSTETSRVKITCGAEGAVLEPVEDALFPDYEFSRAFRYSFTTLVQRPDVEEPRAERGLEVLVQVLDPHLALLDLGGVATAGGAVPVRLTIRNNSDRTVTLDPARVDLVPAAGPAAAPLSGPALAAALAPGGAGDRLRAELLGPVRVAAHTTVIGFLVYPPGAYREARIAIEDVETGETEGFVTRVE